MAFCKKHFIFRVLEFVLCMICLILAIFIYTGNYEVIAILIVLLTVSTTFLFITGIDVISWMCLRPINFMTWIMIATAAFLMFCLCTGLIVGLMLVQLIALSIAAFVINLITALVFMIELLFMAKYCKKLDPYWQVGPSGPSTVGIIRDERRNMVDKDVSTCYLLHDEMPVARRDEEIDATRPIMYRYCVSCGEGRKHTRHSSKVKQLPITYGGTFSVSKDAAPLHPSHAYDCPSMKKNARGIFVEHSTTTKANFGVGSQTICTDTDDIANREVESARNRKVQTIRKRNYTCPCTSQTASPRLTTTFKESTEIAIDEALDEENTSQDTTETKTGSAVVIFQAADVKNTTTSFPHTPTSTCGNKRIIAEVITEDGIVKTCGLKKTLFSTPNPVLPGQADYTYRLKYIEDSSLKLLPSNETEIVFPEKELANIISASYLPQPEGRERRNSQDKHKSRTVAVTARTVKKGE